MNRPENSVLVNVHVTPSDEVARQCVAISQSLKSDGTMFVLDGVTKFPHMTVFMFRVANDHDRLREILEAVKQALKGVESFPCEHTGYFMTEGRYFEASYERTQPFMALHERLIDALQEFRLNPGRPYVEGYFTPYTDEQRENAERTGYDLAHNLFRPHITLTRYHEGRVPAEYPPTPDADLSFMLQNVCVYKADDNGAVYEKLAEFKI